MVTLGSWPQATRGLFTYCQTHPPFFPQPHELWE
jgi:hypothetical protein